MLNVSMDGHEFIMKVFKFWGENVQKRGSKFNMIKHLRIAQSYFTMDTNYEKKV